MASELQEEFQQVRASAYRSLRKGMLLPRRARSKLRYLILPAFADAVAIDVVEYEESLLLYASRWPCDDWKAFASPVTRLKYPRPFLPNLQVEPRNAPPDALGEVLYKLQQISIPLIPRTQTVHTDGVGFELHVGSGNPRVSLHWSNELPDAWIDLQPILKWLEAWAK